ncbi:N-acylamino acid racemase [Clostridium acetobutylicum]|nr:N-acylamino acid racemase [Clostridium acetobutylicum]
MENHDLVIVGGGISGLQAAISAKKSGVQDIVLIEAEDSLGGILNQCIYAGFGMEDFKEELTGTEYVQRFIDEFLELNIEYKLNTTVIKISKNKVITAVSPNEGIIEVKACSIVFAAGAVEKPQKSIRVLTKDLSGIYSALTVGRFINIHGYMPGKSIVILGANKIGNALANRIFIEGGKVKAVIDSEVGFDERNEIIEFLAEINIPFLYNYNIVKIKGSERIEGIYISDENGEKFISCDTLILALKLNPNDKILREANIKILNKERNEINTNVPGVFIVGNALYIHESDEGSLLENRKAGEMSAQYIRATL